MSGEVVKVYEDCLNEDSYGDFVRCLYCGELQVIQRGGTACGNCESENLVWADDRQEVAVGDLRDDKYIIEFV